jgi:hypothetical protein
MFGSMLMAGILGPCPLPENDLESEPGMMFCNRCRRSCGVHNANVSGRCGFEVSILPERP